MNNATHKDKNGTFYKKIGNYWFTLHGNEWWVYSGEPVEKLERIA